MKLSPGICKPIALAGLCFLLALVMPPVLVAQSGFELRSSVMATAGSRTTSQSYELNFTAGQPGATGASTSENKTMHSGYWVGYVIWIPVGIANVPIAFSSHLGQNYPNPFNPITTIRYGVGAPGLVVLDVFNVRGQRVKRLVHASKAAGAYVVRWDGHNDAQERVASGVYFYRLRVGAHQFVRKMVVLK